MAKIAFYADNLTERGTAIALYDYARFSRELLGHDSLVFYNNQCPMNDVKVVSKFQSEFELIPCRDFAEADMNIAQTGCDLLYVIKSGERDDLLSKAIPTMVHCVFPTSAFHVHGAAYAYVSEWLSEFCSGGLIPWVPHIVSVAEADEAMRSELGIPEEALVFGCYGGKDSFDIDFVKTSVIPSVLEANPSTWFVFMNITRFIDHPRVIFLPTSVDLHVKRAFINTCDAMIHARSRGETFGLAVGEFSLCGKPVLTYGGSRERAHIVTLGSSALIYRTPDQAFALLTSFDRGSPSASATYRTQFSPKPAMEMFQEKLVKLAEASGMNGARDRLGYRRWDPRLLGKLKLNKLLRRHCM